MWGLLSAEQKDRPRFIRFIMVAASKRKISEVSAVKTQPHGLNSRNSKQAKKSKETIIADAKALSDPLRSGLLSDSSIKSLRTVHDASGPYRYVVIDNLCQDDRMRAIHEEALHTMRTSLKETDLFKLYQTGDLAVLGTDQYKGAPAPQLLALRKAIYSPEFRSFVSHITGATDLTNRVDCSANAYTHGCHLLCHDDVIGTRRIAYIIYLTDPDEEWTSEYGGALELYPLHRDPSTKTLVEVQDANKIFNIEQGIPAVRPTNLIMPVFNRMALFEVQPGRSYHSVQEVYAPDKVRLSISGWYHGTCPPLGSDEASLAKVMSKEDPSAGGASEHMSFSSAQVASYEPPSRAKATEKASKAKDKAKSNGKGNSKVADSQDVVVSALHPLLPGDLEHLKRFINPMYLREKELTQIREDFIENSSIQLADFFIDSISQSLIAQTKQADELQKVGRGRAPAGYDVAVAGGWQEIGPPHKRKHLQYVPNASLPKAPEKGVQVAEEVGRSLHQLKQEVFQSESFARYLSFLTTLKPITASTKVRRFRAGMDYTVAHFGAIAKESVLDATWSLVNDDPRLSGDGECSDQDDDDDSDEIPEWENGDCGGFEVYLSEDVTEEGDTAAATESGQGQAASVTSGAGTREEDDNTLLTVTPGCNVLSLVMRCAGVMRFIKYVNSTASGSRWDIASEYHILQEE